MDELIDRRDSADELEAEEPGTTMVYGDSGWESAVYIDPEQDWSPLEDGSYVSPDGTIRTWPLVSFEPF